MPDANDIQQRASSELRLIADAIPVHLLHLDLEERILFVNRAAAAMWDVTVEQMTGRTIAEVVGEEAQRALHAFTRRVAQGETVVYEAPFVGPDGQTRHFLNTYSPEHAPDGRIVGFVVTGQDITQRRQAEDALRRTKEQEEEHPPRAGGGA